MSFRSDAYDPALIRAMVHARAWLDSVAERPVGPRATAVELLAAFDGPLPDGPTPPEEVVDLLATLSEPGLMAIQSGRFFGWVMGGTLPAALAADWLVSAWDQNTGMRLATPATATAEEAAAGWLLELLGLTAGADVGFVTGATMANFTCLGAARTAVLSRLGWDVARDGLAGAPKVLVLAGEERHDTVDLALRYLGLGSPTLVAADDQGRIRVDALTEALNAVESGTPVVVCLQAGNVHSGAFDPFQAAIEIAHRHQAWVHIDGAFGLWAAAAPSLSHLVDGAAGADSWGTDAHKTLNVPYDCGIAIVADSGAMRSTFGAHASYLISDDSGPGDPLEKVPARHGAAELADVGAGDEGAALADQHDGLGVRGAGRLEALEQALADLGGERVHRRRVERDDGDVAVARQRGHRIDLGHGLEHPYGWRTAL